MEVILGPLLELVYVNKRYPQKLKIKIDFQIGYLYNFPKILIEMLQRREEQKCNCGKHHNNSRQRRMYSQNQTSMD